MLEARYFLIWGDSCNHTLKDKTLVEQWLRLAQGTLKKLMGLTFIKVVKSNLLAKK